MLELVNLNKKFGQQHVLKDINLTILEGNIVTLLGPSGCGKTTLLNAILGLTDITSGEIIYKNRPIHKVPMEKRGFNIVFQDFALFPHLNAMNNITYGLRNIPAAERISEEELNSYIELLELNPHLNKKVHELSGGQKQRVSIARTLVMKPRILLMDEPLSALDGVIKESIKIKIQEIAKTYGLTIIIVTHDPEEALTISDQVVILDDGRISQLGTPQEIINQPSNPFINKFILQQLYTKRENIYKLFGDQHAN